MSRALLLSPDDQAVSAITGVLEEMAVSCERPLDGVSAAQKLNSHNFDLVLVDCENLPAAKLIFDVCRRGKVGQSPIPIAIVDGRAGLPTAFRLGAELILTKPVSKDHARSTIRTAVGRVRKEESAPTTPDLDAIGKIATEPSKEQAIAAAATAAPTPISAPPPIIENTLAETAAVEAVAPAAFPSPTLQASTAVKEVPVEASTPAPQPRSGFAFAPVAKRVIEPRPALKADPEEKLSEDPVLAEIDKVEVAEFVSPAPILSSLSPARVDAPKPKQRGGPVVLLFLILAGGGFYAAWMYQPGFREMVTPQVERVLALVGRITQPGAGLPVKAPVPAQQVATPTPDPTTPSATPGNEAPASHASAATTSAETATAVPAAEATTPALTPGAATSSTTQAKTVSTTAFAGSNEPTVSTVDSGTPGRTISPGNTPEMAKNVVILSSKGAEKRLINRVPPVYPKEAKAAGVEGTVVLKVLISDTGKVADAALAEGNPTLANAAIRAVKQWRYRPYARDGKELPFQTIVMVDFRRQ